jgi:hypothetical protein
MDLLEPELPAGAKMFLAINEPAARVLEVFEVGD